MTRVGVASVRGGGHYADVQEVVGVTEVLTQPLQRRLKQWLDAVDHHQEALLLTFARNSRRVHLSEQISQSVHSTICGHWPEQLLDKWTVAGCLVYPEGDVSETSFFCGNLHQLPVHRPKLIKLIIL